METNILIVVAIGAGALIAGIIIGLVWAYRYVSRAQGEVATALLDEDGVTFLDFLAHESCGTRGSLGPDSLRADESLNIAQRDYDEYKKRVRASAAAAAEEASGHVWAWLPWRRLSAWRQRRRYAAELSGYATTEAGVMFEAMGGRVSR